jgi:hypothetical protein
MKRLSIRPAKTIAVLLMSACCLAARAVPATAPVPLSAYRAHLVALGTLVSECAQQTVAAKCDPDRVGPDDTVLLEAGQGVTRRVIYDWIRATLSEAASAKGGSPHAAALLAAAQHRLAQETQQALLDRPRAADTPAMRARLSAILASAEFAHVHQPSLLSVLWDRLLEWLFRGFALTAGAGARSVWVGRIFWTLLFLAAASPLLWWFRRHLRQQGRAPEPAASAPAQGTLRDWEAWFARSQQLADQAQWREAIHALYWAAIARFEAQGRCPRDRARTPREYLAMLQSDSHSEPEFALLTRCFERTWYGCRPAGAGDLEAARTLFAHLEPRWEPR